MWPASYLATDAQPGPGVDLVCPAEKLPDLLGDGSADIVLTTEMLEHAEAWRAAVTGMVRVLAPGGLLRPDDPVGGVPVPPAPGGPLAVLPGRHGRDLRGVRPGRGAAGGRPGRRAARGCSCWPVSRIRGRGTGWRRAWPSSNPARPGDPVRHRQGPPRLPPAYLRIAAELGPPARVCEVGVEHGHGLDLFQALFPDGLVCGVDADGGCRWPEGTVRVICDQDSVSLPGRLAGRVAGVGPDRGRRVPRRGQDRGDVRAAVAPGRPGRVLRDRGLAGGARLAGVGRLDAGRRGRGCCRCSPSTPTWRTSRTGTAWPSSANAAGEGCRRGCAAAGTPRRPTSTTGTAPTAGCARARRGAPRGSRNG